MLQEKLVLLEFGSSLGEGLGQLLVHLGLVVLPLLVLVVPVSEMLGLCVQHILLAPHSFPPLLLDLDSPLRILPFTLLYDLLPSFASLED